MLECNVGLQKKKIFDFELLFVRLFIASENVAN